MPSMHLGQSLVSFQTRSEKHMNLAADVNARSWLTIQCPFLLLSNQLPAPAVGKLTTGACCLPVSTPPCVSPTKPITNETALGRIKDGPN